MVDRLVGDGPRRALPCSGMAGRPNVDVRLIPWKTSDGRAMVSLRVAGVSVRSWDERDVADARAIMGNLLDALARLPESTG